MGTKPAATAAAEPPEEPPGHPAGIVRVAGGAGGRRLGRRSHGELVHVGLAHEDGSRLSQSPDDGGVVGRQPALEDARRAGGRDPPGAEVVLHGHGHAGQRARVPAVGHRGVDGGRLGPGHLGGDEGEGMERSVVRGDGGQGLFDHVGRRPLPAADGVGQAARRSRRGHGAHRKGRPVTAPPRGRAGPGTGGPRRRGRRRGPRRDRGSGPARRGEGRW